MCRKALVLFFAFLFSIESMAAVVSDNDGSAFITKAEFDSLKNNFQSQLDSYNTNIDSKIDNAISSYLAGIKAEKTTSIALNNDVRRVRCMNYKSNTETKDLAYVWCAAQISGQGSDWTCGYSGDTQYGTYCHDIVWNKKSSYSKTGERNMIDNLFIDNTTHSNSSALWKGHYKNVIDILTLTYGGSRLNANYGNHMTHSSNQNQGLISPSVSLIYNSDVINNTWNLGTYLEGNKFIDGNESSTAKWNANKDVTVSGYYLDTTSVTINDVNLIIYRPETYYAFTPVQQKFFGFDKIAVCGGDSYTTGPKLHENYSAGSALTWWPQSVGTSTCAAAYSQSNLSTYAGYGMKNLGTTMYNWDNRPDVSSLIRSTSYNKTNGRWIWPYPSFPYKDIMDWYQLYLSTNDWALEKTKTWPSDATIRKDANNNSHFSLNAGWPVVALKKGRKYEMEISFAESGEHLLFLKYGPFNMTYSTNSIPTDTIRQQDITHNGSTTDRAPNAIKVDSDKTVKFSFIAAQDDVLFLKWCDNKTSGSFVGGGTIILPDNVIETQIDS